MAASGIRMGGVFVEIGADAAKFFSTLGAVNKEIGKIGRSIASFGTSMAGVGVGMAVPIAAAVRQGTQFESTLLNIKASTGATAGELDRITAAAMSMSQSLGVGPTEAAQGMLELLKAGVPLETVLNGAGKAAIEFSKVAALDGAMAATVMSKAMNAFGVDSTRASNALSAAADASATSIPEIAQAFSQVSAVAASSNQSIEDTAAALALLANKGIVGSDAGTSVKTMLQRLKAPSDEAAAAMATVGLSIASLRNESSGKLLDLPALIGKLEQAFASVDETTKDIALKKIFGDDAIRAAEIFRTAGKKTFDEVMAGMQSSLTVSDKYKVMMLGLAGAGANAAAAMERLSISISNAVAPSVIKASTYLTGLASGLATIVVNNKEFVTLAAQVAAGLVATGSVMAGLGLAIQAVSYGFAGLGKAAYLIVAPLALIVTTAFSIATSFIGALASAVAYAAGAVASATATAAAWGLANVPLIAMAGVLVAIGGLAAGVVAGLVSGAADVAAAFGNAMQPAIQRAGDAFVEIKRIGLDAFGAIKDAIAGGDLQGAMEVAISGLQAAFSVGSKAFMDSVDEWGVNLVNAFDFYISQIPFLRFLGPDKYTFSVFGDSTQGTNANDRADQRFLEMDRRKARRDVQSADAVKAFDAIIASRQEKAPPADALPTATSDAVSTSLAVVFGPSLPSKISDAMSPPESLGNDIAATLTDLNAHLQPFENIPSAPDTTSMAKVAGTFSSLNLGAAFGGQSAADRTAKACEAIERNTRDMKGDKVAA